MLCSVPAGLYAGCEYNSCWHNRSEVIEAIKICAKTNASLGLSYDPWSSFWTSDPTVRGKQQACCEQIPCHIHFVNNLSYLL